MALRMVASDLDGTFLDAAGQVSELNLAACRRAADAGVQLVFATGRPARWLQVLEPLKLLHPLVIASNGAVSYDLQEGRIVRAHLVPIDLTAEVAAEIATALPGVEFAVEYTRGWGRTPGFPARGDRVEADVILPSAPELLAARDAVKLLALHHDVNTHDMAEVALPISEGRLSGTFSMVLDAGLLEFNALGVTKASALSELLAASGIDASELAAFGDMPNDLEMLALAGLPFAMADGHPSLHALGYPSGGRHDESGFGSTLMALLDALGEVGGGVH